MEHEYFFDKLFDFVLFISYTFYFLIFKDFIQFTYLYDNILLLHLESNLLFFV